MNQQPTETQKQKTAETIRKIAVLRIKALKLNITVDEYIKRAQEQSEKK